MIGVISSGNVEGNCQAVLIDACKAMYEFAEEHCRVPLTHDGMPDLEKLDVKFRRHVQRANVYWRRYLSVEDLNETNDPHLIGFCDVWWVGHQSNQVGTVYLIFTDRRLPVTASTSQNVRDMATMLNRRESFYYSSNSTPTNGKNETLERR